MNMIGEKCQTKKIEIFRMLAVVVVACLLRLYASRYSHMFDSSLVNVFECALGHIFNLLCVMEQSKNILYKKHWADMQHAKRYCHKCMEESNRVMSTFESRFQIVLSTLLRALLLLLVLLEIEILILFIGRIHTCIL